MKIQSRVFSISLSKCALAILAIASTMFPNQLVIANPPETSQREGSLNSRPNIVILLADDLGYGELGCQGNKEIATPNIDSIAEAGIRFTQGYVTSPYCSASRAGIMSGRYPTRYGYERNPIGAQNEHPDRGLPSSEITLARTMQDAGYATALVGKWHLGGHANFHPIRRGFDEFFGFTHEGHYFNPPPHDSLVTMLRRRRLPSGLTGRWTNPSETLVLSTHMSRNEPSYDANNPIVRAGQPVTETEYLTRAFTREAVSFIERHHDRPFFLYLAYNAVHSPLQAPQETLETLGHISDIHRRIFAGMVVELDHSVGSVLKAISAHELERDTLVFFLSDNGGPTRELTSSNLPLRGGKGELYEGGVRVPFMMRWDGTVGAGITSDLVVSSMDIYGTAAAIVKAPTKLQNSLDGVDLLPFLNTDSPQKKTQPHRELFWRLGNRNALRHENWKIVRQGRRQRVASWQLFDLERDPAETHDLSAEYPEVLHRLVNRWEQLSEEMPATPLQ